MSLTVKSAKAVNFKGFKNFSIDFNPLVTYLIGTNGMGKTDTAVSILHATLQSIAEKTLNNCIAPIQGERFRFIGKNGATAKTEIVLHDDVLNCDITISRKIKKEGSELSIDSTDGVIRNQAWINDFFNLFMICPKRFFGLTPKEQAKAIGIDTAKFDLELKELKDKYTPLNSNYKAMGELGEVEKVEPVDLTALQAQKQTIKDKLNSLYLENKKANEALRNGWVAECKKIDDDVKERDAQRQSANNDYMECKDALTVLQNFGYEGKEGTEFCNTIFKKILPSIASDKPYEPVYKTELPNDAELQKIDQQITDSVATNQKAENYKSYLKKVAEKQELHRLMTENKAQQNTVEENRIKYIKDFELPFANLSIGGDGELLKDNRPINENFHSTGELLKMIPILIATTNPTFKYVFIQDFHNLDEKNQQIVIEHLTSKGFQLVIELVGTEPIQGSNSILIKDNAIVESYEEKAPGTLL